MVFCFPFQRFVAILSRLSTISFTKRSQAFLNNSAENWSIIWFETPDVGLSPLVSKVLRFDKFLNRRAHHSIVRSSCSTYRQVSVRCLLCLSFILLLECRERVVHLRHHFTFCRTSHESDMTRVVSFSCVFLRFVKLGPRDAARKRSAARWVT